jgi:hypothetical protein
MESSNKHLIDAEILAIQEKDTEIVLLNNQVNQTKLLVIQMERRSNDKTNHRDRLLKKAVCRRQEFDKVKAELANTKKRVNSIKAWLLEHGSPIVVRDKDQKPPDKMTSPNKDLLIEVDQVDLFESLKLDERVKLRSRHASNQDGLQQCSGGRKKNLAGCGVES